MNQLIKVLFSLWTILSFPFLGFGKSEVDKRDVLGVIGSELFSAYKNQFANTVNRPRVFIDQLVNHSTALDRNDELIFKNLMEEKLSKITVILHRDSSGSGVDNEHQLHHSGAVSRASAESLGEYIGASQVLYFEFTEDKRALGANRDRITLSVKMSAVEVKTKRQVFTKTSHKIVQKNTQQKSYPIRDLSSGVLLTASKFLLVGSIGYGIKSGFSRRQYVQATHAEDAVAYRLQTEREETIALTAGAAFVTTWVAGTYLAALPRDETEIVEYEFTLVPTWQPNYFGVGLAWNF